MKNNSSSEDLTAQCMIDFKDFYTSEERIQMCERLVLGNYNNENTNILQNISNITNSNQILDNDDKCLSTGCRDSLRIRLYNLSKGAYDIFFQNK